jgi:hypothetical protein
MRAILILGMIILLAACVNNVGNVKDDKATEFRMVVNDSVIALDNVSKVTFPLMWYFDVYNGEKALDISKANMKFTESQVKLYAVEQYMAEAGAGGHYQFFSNPVGILWKYALDGLEEMGLTEHHALLDTVIQKIGGHPSFDVAERNRLLDSLDPGFSREDSLFFELKKKIGVDEKMMQFVKANSREFYFDRMVKRPN